MKPRGFRQLRAGATFGFLVLASAVTRAEYTFDDGFENGLSAWNTAKTSGRIISTDKRDGDKCYEFVDNPGVERSEMTALSGGTFDWGTEYWEGFSLKIVEAPASNTFRIVAQQHSVPHLDNSGKPVWSTVAGNNSFLVRAVGSNFEIYTSTDAANVNVTPPKGAATWGMEKALLPYSLNTWYDFVLHFRFTPDSTGFIKIWVNGQLAVDKTGPTIYTKDLDGLPRAPWQYFKIGQYYGYNSDQHGGIIRYDSIKVWKGPDGSFSTVAPGGASLEKPELSLESVADPIKLAWQKSAYWDLAVSPNLTDWSTVTDVQNYGDMRVYQMSPPSESGSVFYRLARAAP